MNSPGSQFPVAQASSPCPRSSLVSLCLGGGLILLVFTGCGRRSEIAGPINTTDFVIPAGEVVTAVADTTISASRKNPNRWNALPRAGRERGVRVALRQRYRKGSESCDARRMVAANPIHPEPRPVNHHHEHRSDVGPSAEIFGSRLRRLLEPPIRHRPTAEVQWSP